MTRRAGFRPELEGLRAVACLLVTVYHIWFGRVSGGVDVFFVVAGFLITGSLLRQHALDGRLHAGAFLGRLARRLFPAAAVVLVFVIVATLALLPVARWRESFVQVVASALYFENWHLAANSTEYLAVGLDRSAVQHFWAMSVQGQFYLGWLILFGVLFAVAGRSRHLRGIALSALIVVFALGLAYSIVTTAADQQFAFFDTFARGWEFALGGIAAIILPRLILPVWAAATAGWLGLLALLAVGIVLPADAPFPGYVALWPAGATLLVLVAGTSGWAWGADRLLGSRPLVWFGGLTYSLYLWHWPILVFTLTALGTTHAGLVDGLLILGTSLALAIVTTRFVERPLREPTPALRGRIAVGTAIGTAAIVLVTATGLTGVVRVDQAAAQEQARVAELVPDSDLPAAADPTGDPADDLGCFGAASLASSPPCLDPELAGQYFPSADPVDDLPAIFSPDCRRSDRRVTPKLCTFGVADSPVRVLLIGNSHAASWFPAVERLAVEHGWRLDVYFKTSCTFNTVLRVKAGPERDATCQTWTERLLDVLAEAEPYRLVVTSSDAWNSDFMVGGVRDPDAGVAGYRTTWQPIIDRGSTLVVLRDYPTLDDATIDCALRDPASPDCALPRSAALVPLDEDVIARAASTTPGAVLLDLSDSFCTATVCPAVIGNVISHRDAAHLTASYALTLAPFLERALDSALEGGVPPLTGLAEDTH